MKGEVRNPTTVWLLALVTCGLYGMYFYYTMGNELKNYLGKEDINPVMDIVIGLALLPLHVLPADQVREVHLRGAERAGTPNAEDKGVMFLLFMFLCGWGYAKMQEELNRSGKRAEARRRRSDRPPLS